MIWRRRLDELPIMFSLSMIGVILMVTLFVCAGCSSMRHVFTKEIASNSMSLDVRDSFFVPYALLGLNSFPDWASNSKCMDNLTTAPATTISNAHVVPIVRHLSVRQVADELQTNETTKTSEVPIPGSSVVSKYSFKVIGLLLVLVVAILLIFVRRKH